MIMNSKYIIRTTVVLISILLISTTQSQVFVSGGFQEGDYASGGHAVPVKIDENQEMTDELGFIHYPNPFTDNMDIRFNLAVEEFVSIHIFDINGREVKSLTDHKLKAGEHKLIWDGSNNSNSIIAKGVYYIRFRAGDDMIFCKVIRL